MGHNCILARSKKPLRMCALMRACQCLCVRRRACVRVCSGEGGGGEEGLHYGVTAYIVMAYLVMADIVMADIVMADTVMAFVIMA